MQPTSSSARHEAALFGFYERQHGREGSLLFVRCAYRWHASRRRRTTKDPLPHDPGRQGANRVVYNISMKGPAACVSRVSSSANTSTNDTHDCMLVQYMHRRAHHPLHRSLNKGFARASRNGCSIWAWVAAHGCSIWAWVAARSIGLGSLLDLGWGRWFKMATP